MENRMKLDELLELEQLNENSNKQYLDIFEEVKPKDFYSIYESKEEIEEIEIEPEISKEDVDEIILDKLLNDMFGLSANNVDYKQQEAFRLYKIFNIIWV